MVGLLVFGHVITKLSQMDKTLCNTNLRYMYMYVCLHPVPYNSNHVHVGTNSYLLDAKDKMKQFTYSVHVRNLLSNTMHKEVWITICFWARTAHLPLLHQANILPCYCYCVIVVLGEG